VSKSVVRSGALWPDTLAPAPQTETKGVVPVGRGVAPRSCSPGTPKRGEHQTRSLDDGATRPEGTQVRVDENVRTVRRVDSGDYTPQDRRRTNIGLLQNGGKYSQTVRPQHWAPKNIRENKPKRHWTNGTQTKSIHEQIVNIHLRLGRFTNFTFVSFLLFICLLVQLSVGKELINKQFTVHVPHNELYGIQPQRLAGFTSSGPSQKSVEQGRSTGKNINNCLLTNHRPPKSASEKSKTPRSHSRTDINQIFARHIRRNPILT
jgi:hypothetical protein